MTAKLVVVFNSVSPELFSNKFLTKSQLGRIDEIDWLHVPFT